MIYWEAGRPQMIEVVGDVRGMVASSFCVGELAKDAQLVAKGVNEEVWCLTSLIFQEVARAKFEEVVVDDMRNGCE